MDASHSKVAPFISCHFNSVCSLQSVDRHLFKLFLPFKIPWNWLFLTAPHVHTMCAHEEWWILRLYVLDIVWACMQHFYLYSNSSFICKSHFHKRGHNWIFVDSFPLSFIPFKSTALTQASSGRTRPPPLLLSRGTGGAADYPHHPLLPPPAPPPPPALRD